jgi:putative phosphoribosyl transferase
MDKQKRDAGAKVRIISRSGEPFRNRLQAGQLLARELSTWQGEKAVVLGIPRGGVVVARSLSEEIKADLDIVLSRKLGAPDQSELAIGAIAESGEVFLNRYLMEQLSVSSSYIEREKKRQRVEIRRRSQLIRRVKPKVSLEGRMVVVTDDGVATGATMQAAVWAVRHENPRALIAAVPVASEEAVERLAQEVDELICLRLPPMFRAVGQFYLEFGQVTDQEVLDILFSSQDSRYS